MCWGLLCEPVRWPGCPHHFCLLCSLRTRRRQAPTCPLCRAKAPRVWKPAALQVDSEKAAAVRRSVGFSAYESQRRQIWAAASEAPAELRGMSIFCTKLRPKQLRAGRRLGLRFFEPRCREMVKRAVAPGGSRRFAAVTRTSCAANSGEAEIAVGARGRLCEIMESTEGEDGAWHVIVETGAACKVLAVTAEEIYAASAPLLIGELDEIEEEDEYPEDGNEDGSEDEAVVLSEEGRVEMLRERANLLELLNAAMELERARLEQRRLELTMLLSQRQLYQDLMDMHTEVAALAGMATRSNPIESRRGLASAGIIGVSSSSSDHWPRATRVVIGPSRELTANRSSINGSISRRSPIRTPVGSTEGLGLLALMRRPAGDANASAANGVPTGGMSVGTDQRARRGSRNNAAAASAHAERVTSQTEALRSRALERIFIASEASSPSNGQAHGWSGATPRYRSSPGGSSARGQQPRGSRG